MNQNQNPDIENQLPLLNSNTTPFNASKQCIQAFCLSAMTGYLVASNVNPIAPNMQFFANSANALANVALATKLECTSYQDIAVFVSSVLGSATGGMCGMLSDNYKSH